MNYVRHLLWNCKMQGGVFMEKKAEIKKIVVDGNEYVFVGSVQEFEGAIKIVILQRGWVMIGVFERNGNDCKLHNASVIRKWGTTEGLPELSIKGKLPDTILDKCYGVVEFDYLTVVATISVMEEKWVNVL